MNHPEIKLLTDKEMEEATETFALQLMRWGSEGGQTSGMLHALSNVMSPVVCLAATNSTIKSDPSLDLKGRVESIAKFLVDDFLKNLEESGKLVQIEHMDKLRKMIGKAMSEDLGISTDTKGTVH